MGSIAFRFAPSGENIRNAQRSCPKFFSRNATEIEFRKLVALCFVLLKLLGKNAIKKLVARFSKSGQICA